MTARANLPAPGLDLVPGLGPRESRAGQGPGQGGGESVFAS